PLPGTDNGHSPIFSPDGRWIAFFADGSLKKVAVAGGAPTTIAPAPDPAGAAWAAAGRLAYAPSAASGLWTVGAQGGAPQPLAARSCSPAPATPSPLRPATGWRSSPRPPTRWRSFGRLRPSARRGRTALTPAPSPGSPHSPSLPIHAAPPASMPRATSGLSTW